MNIIYEIKQTPKVTLQTYQKFITKDIILQELIETFIKVLEKNIPKEKLNLMYNNLSTLTIQNKNIIPRMIASLYQSYITTGEYYLYENIISLLPITKQDLITKCIGISLEEYIENLYHELLHMSSTIIDKENNIAYSGFYQISKTNINQNTNSNKLIHKQTKPNEIGVAIDDAYTEILLYRLFKTKKRFMSYKYEIQLISIIEEILTKEKMTNLYFNASLYDLVKSLESYSTTENIIEFITNLDTIYNLTDYYNKYKSDIIIYHHKILNFITDIYFNKLKQDITLNNITLKTYNHKIRKYLHIIHNSYKYLELDKLKYNEYKKLLIKIKELNKINLSIFNNKINNNNIYKLVKSKY